MMTRTNSENAAWKDLVIVGIGASAGGLEAATQLLKALPPDLGMGFVLVQHLDPAHESILTDLLSKVTKMPVEEASDNTQVEPNHVYVIPHNKDITIKDGILKLRARSISSKPHLPIDQFMLSLAQSQKNKAVGIILSGTASDGTLGLKAIKSEGGITFAQDETAKYQGMPKAAIASGHVDFILSPLGIANELARMNKHPYIKHTESIGSVQESPEENDGLMKIFSLLLRSSNIDFRHYKTSTINRRIRRRMLLHKLTSFEEYVRYLKDNSGEIESLRDDLLINVTSFFREPQVFDFLQKSIFPRLIKDRPIKEVIRIWVPGCATGEEVYTIAISLSEFLTEHSLKNPVQIFGTDLSKAAVEKARSGVYSQQEVAGISPKRLARFFDKTDEVYRISKSIREFCIFAQQNVFGDPPFSKLDLISCCNLLIYLDVSLQEKILRIFHYALKPGRFLMLGKSEAVGASSELFSQINKKYKIYARKDTAVRGIVNFSMISPKLEIQDDVYRNQMNKDTIVSDDIQKEVDGILLNRYMPASVVINSDFEITEFRGSTGAYLEPRQGKPSFNLIKMAREGLGFEIRSAVSHAKKSGHPYKKEKISLKHGSHTRNITIEVLPLKTTPEFHYLVLFEETKNKPQTDIFPNEKKVTLSKHGAKDKRIAELEQELYQTHEDMRSINEEQEATNEELQTANEEILSSNEELQSINEELETSKEELESTNEELTTVNEELHNRNEQVIASRNYAEAIIRTVQMPLLILDRNLIVKSANRSFCQMFRVSEEETIGTYVFDLGNGQWNIPSLRNLLNQILPQNNSFDNYEIEHTFPNIGHKIMLLNARKFYKDGDNILLAIEDVTDRKEIEIMKDAFTGIASHELKTPLTSMKGYVQLLNKLIAVRGDEKEIGMIEKVSEQMSRMTNLINELLNASKIQMGKLELQKKPFDLEAMVTNVIADFRITVKKHQIIKEGEIKEQVIGDQSHIEEVLTNIMTNAVKYSPHADRVIIRLETDKRNAIVSIQDFGFGIQKQDQVKVFERFYRTSDNEKKSISGFGLGLYIAAEIIKAHNGHIWVESTEGKGSTFYFSLPLAEEKSANLEV